MAPLERLERLRHGQAHHHDQHDSQQPAHDAIGEIARDEVVGADAEIRWVVYDVGQLVEDAQQHEQRKREEQHELRDSRSLGRRGIRVACRGGCGLASLHRGDYRAHEHKHAQRQRHAEDAHVPVARGYVRGVLLEEGHNSSGKHGHACANKHDTGPEPAPCGAGIRVHDTREDGRYHEVFNDVYEVSLHIGSFVALRAGLHIGVSSPIPLRIFGSRQRYPSRF